MKFKVKDIRLETGGVLVVVLNRRDAQRLDLHLNDRVLVREEKNRNNKTVAILDIAESSEVLPLGSIGCMREVLKKLRLKEGSEVVVEYAMKPEGIALIRKKLDGMKLTEKEYDTIISDIVRDELTEGELTYFVSGCYMRGLTIEETVGLTNAIVKNGEQLHFTEEDVYDKHCIGGIPGNRTTIILVPILTAAGLKMPKTSSRSITSPAGTADTMEVLAPVVLPAKKMQSMVAKIGGFIAWGGGVELAAADDRLIRVRNSMGIDPEGMLLASILGKKKAAGSTKVLIDIPMGKHTKIRDVRQAERLKRLFVLVGKKLGMHVEVITTDGSQPIGNGIGPALEARDILYIFRRDLRAPKDLEHKALKMATYTLRMAGVKHPEKKARDILESGLAYRKFKEIIKAQGGNPKITPEQIKIGKCTKVVAADKKGYLKELNTSAINHVARVAGAPLDKGAGVLLHRHVGAHVNVGDPILTIYAESLAKLNFALKQCATEKCYTIGKR